MRKQRGCLDPEVVAAYLDQRLAATERRLFEAHLAGCEACTSLVAEVVRTVGDLPERVPVHQPTGNIVWTRSNVVWTRSDPPSSPPPPEAQGNVVWTKAVWGPERSKPRRRESWQPNWGALAAAATIVAMLGAPSLLTRLQPRDTRLADLADAVGESRLVEGRLSGGFPHAPLRAPLAGGQGGATVVTVRLELAAGKIREEVDRRSTPERLHAFGVSQLLLGRYNDAAMALSAAAREQSANARYQNDVATAYLERARSGDRADDLPRALAAAERARLADPQLIEAWFNRALALSRLSLREQARDAWGDYLARDSSSPWATDARRYLDNESAATPAMRWQSVELRLRENVTATVADEALRIQMTNARQFVEGELFPAWANAVTQGGDPASPREALRVLADSFSRVAGDDLYRDAVAAIDRAESQGGDAVRRLAAAHRAYTDAQALLADDRFSESGPGLLAARDGFAASRSAFEQRAAIDLGAVAYVGGRSDEAAAAFAAIAAVSGPARYGYVTARASWFHGLIAFSQGRFADARAAYERTLGAFETAGDTEQLSVAHALLAGLHDYLGDQVEAWHHRKEALEGLRLSDSARFRYSILAGVAGAAFKQLDTDTAIILQNAAVENAKRMSRPTALSEALTQRATMLTVMGRLAEARSDLAQARASLSAVGEATMRQRRQAAILSIESEFVQFEPEAAAVVAQQAIDLSQAIGDRASLPQMYLRLGRALQAQGQAERAEQAVRLGIAAFEQEVNAVARAGGLAANSGTSTADQSWRLYAVAAQMALNRGDRAAAFDLAEKSRARTVAGTPALAQVQSSLSPDEALVTFNQFDDELLVWLIRPDGTSTSRRALSAKDASGLVARFRDEVTLGATSPAAGAALFNELIKPFAAQLRNVAHLIIVPDLPYRSVAFPGLWDSGARRFLVEARTISVVGEVAAVGGRSRRVAGPAAGLVEIANAVTPDVAFRLLSELPERGMVAVSAPARSNAEYPLLSRVDLSDVPGRPHSGMVLTRQIAASDLSKASAVLLTRISGDSTISLAHAFLAAGAGTVVGTVASLDTDSSAALFENLRATVNRDTSVVDSVNALQRNVLRETGHRLGAWSNLIVYGAGR